MLLGEEQIAAKSKRLAWLDWRIWIAALGACAIVRVGIAMGQEFPFRVGRINLTQTLFSAVGGGLFGLIYYWRQRHHFKRLSLLKPMSDPARRSS